jgi:hypothetical protein
MLKYMLPETRAVWTLNLIGSAAYADGAVNTNAIKNADVTNDIAKRFIFFSPKKVTV